MKNLPLYYIEGNNIFCHAGLDEKNEALLEKYERYEYLSDFDS